MDDAYVMNAEDILGAKSCLDWILDILDHKPHPSIFRMIEEIQAAEDDTVYITPDRPIPEMPVWRGSEEERQKVLGYFEEEDVFLTDVLGLDEAAQDEIWKQSLTREGGYADYDKLKKALAPHLAKWFE